MYYERKPRVSYAQFIAQQQKTVAWVIERYITDMATPGMKPLSLSNVYTLRAIQRDPIGNMVAADLKKSDVIDFAKRLRSRPGKNGRPVCPATAAQYVGSLAVAIKYVASAVDGCDDITIAPIEAARPLMLKLQLIGKSEPRTSVPTPDELDVILADADAIDGRHRYPTQIKLLALTLAAIESTRRIGELCRIVEPDIDWDGDGGDGPRYMVRKVKHPTKKATNDRWFPLTPLLAEMFRAMLASHGQRRVFPYNAKSASQAFARLKKRHGYVHLRFHDLRRLGTSKWIEKLNGSLHDAAQINGDTIVVLERHYRKPDMAALHKRMAAAA